MAPSEMERLGRMEAQIDGIREDVTEIKVSIKEDNKEMKETFKEFTSTLASLPQNFLTRQEADKIIESRDRERDGAIKRMENFDFRLQKVELKLKWYAGALAVVVFGITIVAELFHNGVIK